MKRKEDKPIDEINPYQVDKLSKIPSWLVILVLKFWAAAAAIFFMGIGGVIFINFSENQVDDPAGILGQSFTLIILFGMFLSLFTNYVVKPFIRMMHNRRNNAFRYNLINFKGFKAFLANCVYNFSLSFVLFFITVFLSQHHLVWDPFGTTGGVGIEPFTYAISYIIVDGLVILIKNIIQMIYERAKYNKQMKEA